MSFIVDLSFYWRKNPQTKSQGKKKSYEGSSSTHWELYPIRFNKSVNPLAEVSNNTVENQCSSWLFTLVVSRVLRDWTNTKLLSISSYETIIHNSTNITVKMNYPQNQLIHLGKNKKNKINLKSCVLLGTLNFNVINCDKLQEEYPVIRNLKRGIIPWP